MMRSQALKTNKRAIAAGAVALALAAVLSVGGAMAYFTTYVQAAGGQTVQLGTSTTVHEGELTSWTKPVTVENTGSNPCFVRVQAFSADSHALAYSGSNWTSGADGWYYFDQLLQPGATTDTLSVAIDAPDEADEAAFNVVVVHESTIVSNADGTAGDWSAASGEEA